MSGPISDFVVSEFGLSHREIDRNRYRFTVGIYPQIDVTIDPTDLPRDRELAADAIIKEVEIAQQQLFAELRLHMAKHDRRGMDRVADIERAAGDLIKAIESATMLPPSIAMAAEKLRAVVNAKPGELTWHPKEKP